MTTSLGTEFLARLTVKRLEEMNKTRARVKALELRATALEEAARERRRAELLEALNARVAALGPALRDMTHHVTELKTYLQSVYDADILGDSLLQQLASEHCIGYCVRLLDLISEPSKYALKGATGVLELGTSTLAMFAARASVTQALMDAGAVNVLIKLLSPLYPTVVVVNTANAVSHLAAHASARLSFRASGGVGALVRLLRSDVEPSAQTAAAAALSLLAARDLVVQDSVRYLGGLTHLIDLLASTDAFVSETARYTLLALRHGNVKNQAEIITGIRAHSGLARSILKLDACSELLRFEDSPAPLSPRPASALLRTPASPRTLLGTAAEVRALINDLTATTLATNTALKSPRSVSSGSSLIKGLDLDPYSPASPSAALGLDTPSSPSAASASWTVGASPSSALVEVETELLRKKHLARFSHEELVLLLEEMGFDSLDMRGFRLHRVDGTSLLTLSEDQLRCDLVLPPAKVRKLRALQRAAALFDAIATLPRQGRVSETELRLYLAGQGASTAEVNKVIKLCRTLVRIDKYDFITFWDFVTSYDWIAQALRIYSIPA